MFHSWQTCTGWEPNNPSSSDRASRTGRRVGSRKTWPSTPEGHAPSSTPPALVPREGRLSTPRGRRASTPTGSRCSTPRIAGPFAAGLRWCGGSAVRLRCWVAHPSTMASRTASSGCRCRTPWARTRWAAPAVSTRRSTLQRGLFRRVHPMEESCIRCKVGCKHAGRGAGRAYPRCGAHVGARKPLVGDWGVRSLPCESWTRCNSGGLQ